MNLRKSYLYYTQKCVNLTIELHVRFPNILTLLLNTRLSNAHFPGNRGLRRKKSVELYIKGYK